MDEIRLTNYNMAFARLIGAILFAPLAVLGVLIFLDEPGLKTFWACALGIGGPAVFVWMAISAVTVVTIGEKLRVRAFFGSKYYPLTDIVSVGFQEISTSYRYIPNAKHFMLQIVLRCGRNIQLKVSHSAADRVVTLLQERGMHDLLAVSVGATPQR